MNFKTSFGQILNKFIFISILLIALLLRLSYLNFNLGLNYDELYSFKCAIQEFPFGIINFLMQTDYHPPLYFLTLNRWIALFGQSDTSLQGLSVLFSCFSIWITYITAKELINRLLGYTLMLFFTFNILFIQHSQLVRFYMPGLLLSQLSFLFAVKLIKKFNKKYLILFLISNLLLISTQTTGIFVVLSLLICLFFFIKKYDCCNLIKFTKFQLLTLFLAIPQGIMTLIQVYNAKQTILENPWAWFYRPKLINCILQNLEYVLLSGDYNISLMIKLSLFFILICLFLYKLIKNYDKLGCFLLSFFVLYSLLYFCASFFKLIQLNCMPSYYIIFTHFFIVLFFFFIFKIKNKFISSLILLSLIIQSTIGMCIAFKIYFNNSIKTSTSFINPIKTLNENNYNKGLVFAPYGDDLFSKYNNQFHFFGINGDKLFTMSNYKNQADLIFDDDLTKMSLDERRKYLENYLYCEKIGEKLNNTFNKQISTLKKGENFIIILTKERFYNRKKFNKLPSEIEIAIPHIVVAKITNNIIALAQKNPKLKEKELITIDNKWLIIVFEKIK